MFPGLDLGPHRTADAASCQDRSMMVDPRDPPHPGVADHRPAGLPRQPDDRRSAAWGRRRRPWSL